MRTELAFVCELACNAARSVWVAIGTTPLGWIIGLGIPLMVAAMRARRSRGVGWWATLKSQWLTELRDVFYVYIAVWVALFVWKALWVIPHQIRAEAGSTSSLEVRHSLSPSFSPISGYTAMVSKHKVLPGAPAIPVPYVASSIPPPVDSSPGKPFPPLIDANAPVACPPHGTLSRGWSFNVVENPPTFSNMYPGPMRDHGQQLHPLLQERLHDEPTVLDVKQLRGLTSLIAEFHSFLPKTKPLNTADGPIALEKVDVAVTHNFLRDSNTVDYSYADKTSSGVIINHDDTEIPINSLTDSSRATIARFDTLSNTEADKSCKDTLDSLRVKP